MKNKTMFDFVWDISKKYKFRIFIFFFSMFFLFNAIPLFISPYLFKLFGDKYQFGDLTTFNVFILSFLYALFFAMPNLFRFLFLEKYIWYGVFWKIQNELKQKLFNYTIQHSIKYYNNSMSGVVAKQIDNATSNVANTFDNFFMLISVFISIIISLIIYIKINYYIAVVFIIWAILFSIFYYQSSKLVFKAKKESKFEKDKLNGILNDNIVNILNIKSFSNKFYEKKLIKKQNIFLLRKISKEYKIDVIFEFINGISTTLLMLIVIIIAFYLTFKQELTIGTFMFICQNMTLLRRVLHNFNIDIMNFMKDYSEIKVSFYNLLQDVEITDKKDAKELKMIDGKIVFKNITFNYDK